MGQSSWRSGQRGGGHEDGAGRGRGAHLWRMREPGQGYGQGHVETRRSRCPWRMQVQAGTLNIAPAQHETYQLLKFEESINMVD